MIFLFIHFASVSFSWKEIRAQKIRSLISHLDSAFYDIPKGTSFIRGGCIHRAVNCWLTREFIPTITDWFGFQNFFYRFSRSWINVIFFHFAPRNVFSNSCLALCSCSMYRIGTHIHKPRRSIKTSNTLIYRCLGIERFFCDRCNIWAIIKK